MGRYRAIRTVGQGSFGAAILVTRNGEPFIAKEMNIGKMSPVERESVDSEVKILSALKHPNIIRYEESIMAGATLYIVMEFADGGDLYQRISSLKEPMSEDSVLYIFAQICLAVKHLHARRILHRDLKSQNVFLTKDNVVKLGDFGLATALRHTYQQAKSLCGTPNYFSPELVGGRPFNNKSDIWAMGCILYELVTQRFAFPGNTIPEIMQRILYEQPSPVPQSYSEGLRSLLSRMLCKEQAIRPSIDALMRAYVLKNALHRIQKTLEQGQPRPIPRGSDRQVMSPVRGSGVAGAAVGGGSSYEPQLEDSCDVSADHAVGKLAVKSPPHPYVKEEELAELEKDILSDQLALREGGGGASEIALLAEIMHVNEALDEQQAEGEDDNHDEFGDEPLLTGSLYPKTSPSPRSASLRENTRRDSLGGEIEGLLAEFELSARDGA